MQCTLVIIGASAWNGYCPKSTSSKNNHIFHIISNNSSQITCTASSGKDAEVWLASLHSGLEASFQYNSTQARLSNVYQTSTGNCASCGCHIVSNNVFLSCPLPHYKTEIGVRVCEDCHVAQGVLDYVSSCVGLYASHMHERAALRMAHNLCTNLLQKNADEQDASSDELEINVDSKVDSNNEDINPLSESWENILADSFIHVEGLSEQDKQLLSLIQTPGFGTLRRR